MSRRTFDRASLQKLAAIYRYRVVRAESLVREQHEAVQRVRDELAERAGKVEALTRSIEDNDRYRQEPAVDSDARAMERALRYRHWLDYDRQRATFYLELTEEELHEARQELRQRGEALGTIRAKASAVEGLDHASALEEDRRAELSLEEDTEALWAQKGMRHVQG